MTKEIKMLDKKNIRARMLTILCDRFPKAFFPLNKPPKPLKVKIINDILDNKENKSKEFFRDLKIFLAWYTSNKKYLHALIAENSKRVNIHGEEMQDVLNVQRMHAKFELKKLLQKEAERKVKAHREQEAINQSKDMSEKLKSAFEQREAALKARVAAVAANTRKSKLTLKTR